MKCEEARLASEAAGGVTKLAAALGIAPQAISQWKKIPAGRVLQIEEATEGRVRRQDLRPDLYPETASEQTEPARGDDEAGAVPRAGSEAPPGGTATPPPTAQAQVRALSRRAFGAVVVLIVVFAAGVALWPFLLPGLGLSLPAGLMSLEPEVEERIAALEARLAEGDRVSRALHGETARLAEAVAALEQRLEGAEEADVSPDLDRLRADMNQLGARLEAIEARPFLPAEGPVGAGQEELTARLGAVEDALAGAAEQAAGTADLRRQSKEMGARLSAFEEAALVGSGREAALALALALGQLRQALGGSAPYSGALSTVEVLAGHDEALAAPLAVLARHAQAGVSTVDRLDARFAAIAGDIVRAEASGAPEGWLGAARERLSALITVRRVGEIEGGDAEARVARAEARLGRGDLAAAVAEVEGLDGAPAGVVAGWLDAARARLAAEAGLAALEARAIARLGAPRQGQ